MASSAQISADPNFVCIAPGYASSPVRVSYNRGSGPQVRVWFRLRAPSASSWDYMRDPSHPNRPIDPTKGSFTLDIHPNEIMDLALYPSDRGLDPNVPGMAPLAATTVFGFDGAPPEGKWGVDGPRIEVGGTFAVFSFYTMEEVRCVLSVCTAPSAQNPCRFTAFPASSPIVREVEYSPSKLHVMKAEPLLPGTTYNFILEMFDMSGHRKTVERSFSTLRRRITGKVSDIFIEDDGDNTGTGEARIGIAIFEAIQPLQIAYPAQPTMSVSEYFGAIDTGKSITNPPNMEFTIGPKAGDFSIALAAYGTEFDGSTESDEPARSSDAAIKYVQPPTGQNAEVVTNNTVNVRPDVISGSFVFNANVSYSITYVP